MTTENRKFIESIEGLTPETINFLKLNRMDFTVRNVEIKKNGDVSFESITDFIIVENVVLTKDERAVWDLFTDFDTIKNACNSIMYAVENNKDISLDIFDNQSRLFASDKDAYKNVSTFSQFWTKTNDTDKAEIIKLANNYIDDMHIEEDSFEFYFLNGTDGLTFKEGDYLQGYDKAAALPIFGKVIQAEKGGFVTCVDNGSYFTVSKYVSPKIKPSEKMPKGIKDILDNEYTKFIEETDERKDDKITKGIKMEARRLRDEEKEAKRKEREAKKQALEATRIEQATEILKLELLSEDSIKKAVQMVNDAKLDKDRRGAVRTAIKTAKIALKAEQDMVEAMKALNEAKEIFNKDESYENNVEVIKADKLYQANNKFWIEAVETAETAKNKAELAINPNIKTAGETTAKTTAKAKTKEAQDKAKTTAKTTPKA